MKRQYVILIVAVLVLLGLDQLIKWWALENLAGNPSIDIIPGVFRLSYVENRGAAFGILQGKTIFLAIMSLIIVVALVYFYRCIPQSKGYWMLRTAYILILAGALGNQIDRLFRGYVVDMFEFYWFRFPVFNMADCFIVVGGIAVLLIALIRPKMLDGVFTASKEATNG